VYVNRFGSPSGTDIPAPISRVSGIKTFCANDAVGLFPPP